MISGTDHGIQAYTSASYTASVVAAAAHDMTVLQRLVRKAQDLIGLYGESVLKHTAILAIVGAAIAAVVKALENPVISDKLTSTTGKLKQVTELSALGFALYKVVTSLVDAATPNTGRYGDPSLRERLDDLAQKNAELDRALRESHEAVVEHERNIGRDKSKDSVKELREARRERTPQRKRREPVEATAALALVQHRFPGSAMTPVYPEIVPWREMEDEKLLRRIDSFTPQQRDRYAKALAKRPDAAQGFLDRVFDIVRFMRKDPAGAPVRKLGSFVIKWSTIFAVQTIMFKMLTAITGASAFAFTGRVTRMALAALCAVSTILTLVRTSIPEEDAAAVKRIEREALRTRKAAMMLPTQA